MQVNHNTNCIRLYLCMLTLTLSLSLLCVSHTPYLEILSLTPNSSHQSRPLQSKLSTWASPQSQVIPSLSSLHEHVESLKLTYPDGNVPPPPFWGGYRVTPNEMEFWSSQENRLHDRIVYKRDSEKNTWVIVRLAP